jgi:hypothetical protein
MTQPVSSVTVSAAVSELRAAFTTLTHNHPLPDTAELSILRGHVRAAVDEMKAEGALPEHVVITVKRLALDSGIHWTNHTLLNRLVDWCLDRYHKHPLKV